MTSLRVSENRDLERALMAVLLFALIMAFLSVYQLAHVEDVEIFATPGGAFSSVELDASSTLGAR